MRRLLAAFAAAVPLIAACALPGVAQASWGVPFQIEPPGTLDLQAPRLALSAGGAGVAGFGIGNVDVPGSSQAYMAMLGPSGYPTAPPISAPGAVPGAARVMSVAFDRGSAELLTGGAGRGRDCCARAQVVNVSARGRPGQPRTVVGGLAGPAIGRLLALADGQMLAAVATQRGIWVSQSARADRFTRRHLLTGPGQMPESLGAVWLGGERTVIAWTAAAGAAGASDPGSITYAVGSRAAPPNGPRTAVRVPTGHRVDELGLAPRAGVATATWVESWFDAHGAWHSQVRAMDIAPGARPVTLSSPGRLASGLAVAGDPAGDQAVSWESCTVDGSCAAQVAVRRARGGFGAPRTLGSIDPGQQPSVAVGPGGQVVVGFVSGGRPFAASEASPGRGFGRPVALSSTSYAYDLTVAAGAGGRALAAWSQGTLHPSVVAAAFRG